MPAHLRELDPEDIPVLIRLADDPDIADDMTTLPSPYKKKHAEELLKRSASEDEVILGVVDTASGELSGVIMLRDFESQHEQAELSIWIGKEYWGRGLGSAALVEMCRIGFEEHGLNRIYAFTMVRNTASQRILDKAGFTREGLLRERVIVRSIYEDVYIYAKLKRDESR